MMTISHQRLQNGDICIINNNNNDNKYKMIFGVINFMSRYLILLEIFPFHLNRQQ